MKKGALDAITGNLRAIKMNVDNIYAILSTCIENGEINLNEDDLNDHFKQSKKGNPN